MDMTSSIWVPAGTSGKRKEPSIVGNACSSLPPFTDRTKLILLLLIFWSANTAPQMQRALHVLQLVCAAVSSKHTLPGKRSLPSTGNDLTEGTPINMPTARSTQCGDRRISGTIPGTPSQATFEHWRGWQDVELVNGKRLVNVR